MTEQEQLEQNTHHQKIRQQMSDVSAYLDRLTAGIDLAFKKEKDAFIIQMFVWVAWVAVGFFSPAGNALFSLFFMMSIFYVSHRSVQRSRLFGEFKGAIKMLELLGMIPPMGSGSESKKKRLWSEGADMVRGWFKKKEKAQDEAYAPA